MNRVQEYDEPGSTASHSRPNNPDGTCSPPPSPHRIGIPSHVVEDNELEFNNFNPLDINFKLDDGCPQALHAVCQAKERRFRKHVKQKLDELYVKAKDGRMSSSDEIKLQKLKLLRFNPIEFENYEIEDDETLDTHNALHKLYLIKERCYRKYIKEKRARYGSNTTTLNTPELLQNDQTRPTTRSKSPPFGGF